MLTVSGWDNPGLLPPRCVLTIGNFDGVHRGHRRIIAFARERAAQLKLPVLALSFEPHPLKILTPQKAPARLMTPGQKVAELAAAGVDLCVTLEANSALLDISAEDFLRRGVAAHLHPAEIVEGINFGFGKGRRGNVQTLGLLAAECGYRLHVVEPVEIELPGGRRERVSSSLIRRLLQEGDIAAANDGLGRAYVLCGTVVEGLKRGRDLGFPTANLQVEEQVVPADGVYAGAARAAGKSYRAAISIGSTPTFGGGRPQIEAHLIGVKVDLYGQEIELEFQRRLRGQQQFSSVDKLIEQIGIDVAEAAKAPS